MRVGLLTRDFERSAKAIRLYLPICLLSIVDSIKMVYGGGDVMSNLASPWNLSLNQSRSYVTEFDVCVGGISSLCVLSVCAFVDCIFGEFGI